MGCGASKSAIEVLPADGKPINGKSLNAKPVLKPIPRQDLTPSNKEENESDRPDSTSSRDSGYADNEYKNIITEKSNPDLIKKVEEDFKERQSLGIYYNISNKT